MAAAGSMPSAAIFFATYNTANTLMMRTNGIKEIPVSAQNMAAALIGQTVGCLVSVPVEMVRRGVLFDETLFFYFFAYFVCVLHSYFHDIR